MNIHPPLTSFPFVLISCSAVLEIYSLVRSSELAHRASRVHAVAATVFVLAAFFSGYWAADGANLSFKVSEDVIANHHSWAKGLLFVSIALAALALVLPGVRFNKKMFRSAYFLLLVIALGLVVYTGYLGGSLVFDHGAGVSATL